MSKWRIGGVWGYCEIDHEKSNNKNECMNNFLIQIPEKQTKWVVVLWCLHENIIFHIKMLIVVEEYKKMIEEFSKRWAPKVSSFFKHYCLSNVRTFCGE